jgi:hypothetical protein
MEAGYSIFGTVDKKRTLLCALGAHEKMPGFNPALPNSSCFSAKAVLSKPHSSTPKLLSRPIPIRYSLH